MSNTIHDRIRALAPGQRMSSAASMLLAVSLAVVGGMGCQSHATPASPQMTRDRVDQVTQLPRWTNDGQDREVEVLIDDSRVKIAAVALRRGTELPAHSVATAISIQVVQGQGALTVGDTTRSVQPGSIVVIAPQVPHAVAPSNQELMVLLVHYLKQ